MPTPSRSRNRQLQGKGADRFDTVDIQARARFKILSPGGHPKHTPSVVVRNELRPGRHEVHIPIEKVRVANQRNRPEVVVLGSCVVVVMGMFVMLLPLEGQPDSQTPANRPDDNNAATERANNLTEQPTSVSAVPGFSVPARLQRTLTALLSGALPTTAAGPSANAEGVVPLPSEDASQHGALNSA